WHRIFDRVAAVRLQYHVKLDRQLPADPVAAFTDVKAAARNLEARLAGAVVIGDNLGVRLDAARADALYARLLFLFLGLPGALLAGCGLALAACAVVGPAWRDARTLTVRGARQTIGAPGPPLWARLYLDVLLLGLAYLAYRRTLAEGYHVVLAPEGVPTVSVD